MDADLLRKQLTDEIQTQYELKLREAKRQKTETEEELESAEERWRTERRRLNSEIDRLEAALAEAKAPARNKSAVEVKHTGISPEDLAKVQRAAEENLQTAMQEWQAERDRLVSQNARLERAVADAIERSSNPIRSTQAIKDQFEAKLDQSAKQRLEVEQEFLRAKAAWDEDKKKLMAEIMKLRRLAPSKAFQVKEKIERIHGHAESIEEVRIRELESQLAEARVEASKYHETSVKAQQELLTANKELQRFQENRSNTESTATPGSDDRLRCEYEEKIADLMQQRTADAASIEQLQSSIAAYAKKSASGSGDEIRREYDRKITEIMRGKEQAESQIAELQTELKSAREEIQYRRESAEQLQGQLINSAREIESMRRALSDTREQVSSDVMNQLRQQYDSRIQDMIQQKTQLAQELESAATLLQTERSRFASEFSKSSSQPAFEAGGLESEVKRVEELIQGIVSMIDDPSTDLSTVIRKNVEKAELNAYLKGILYSLGRANAL